MPDENAKRIVLRFNVRHEQEEAAINEAFFASHGPKPADDYYSHLCPPNVSSKMHIVLDLRCKTVPTVDLHSIEHQVFMVRKEDKKLYVVLSLEALWLSSKLAPSDNSMIGLAMRLARPLIDLGGALTDAIRKNWMVIVPNRWNNLQADWCRECQVSRASP